MSDARRERQHDEILQMLRSGEVARGCALAAEHLDEFPTDLVIRRLVVSCCSDAAAGDQPE